MAEVMTEEVTTKLRTKRVDPRVARAAISESVLFDENKYDDRETRTIVEKLKAKEEAKEYLDIMVQFKKERKRKVQAEEKEQFLQKMREAEQKIKEEEQHQKELRWKRAADQKNDLVIMRVERQEKARKYMEETMREYRIARQAEVVRANEREEAEKQYKNMIAQRQVEMQNIFENAVKEKEDAKQRAKDEDEKLIIQHNEFMEKETRAREQKERLRQENQQRLFDRATVSMPVQKTWQELEREDEERMLNLMKEQEERDRLHDMKLEQKKKDLRLQYRQFLESQKAQSHSPTQFVEDTAEQRSQELDYCERCSTPLVGEFCHNCGTKKEFESGDEKNDEKKEDVDAIAKEFEELELDKPETPYEGRATPPSRAFRPNSRPLSSRRIGSRAGSRTGSRGASRQQEQSTGVAPIPYKDPEYPLPMSPLPTKSTPQDTERKSREWTPDAQRKITVAKSAVQYSPRSGPRPSSRNVGVDRSGRPLSKGFGSGRLQELIPRAQQDTSLVVDSSSSAK